MEAEVMKLEQRRNEQEVPFSRLQHNGGFHFFPLLFIIVYFEAFRLSV